LKFGDGFDQSVTAVAEGPTGRGFPHFSAARPAEYCLFCGKLLKSNAGEVAEWPNAAVC
jgi:hypothetical protein